MKTISTQKNFWSYCLLAGLMSLSALTISPASYAQAETVALQMVANADTALSPHQALNQLLSEVQNSALSPLTESRLVMKLYGAQTSLERGDYAMANNKLHSFVELLQRQHLENGQALIAQAQPILQTVALQ